MQSVPEEIIAILRNDFHYEVPQTLEVRVRDLYDLGRIAEPGDYEKVIFSINNRRNEMFRSRDFINNAMKVILERQPVSINFLIIGSDLGESVYSAVINIEKNLKQADNVTAEYFVLANSLQVAEKIKKPSFSYDEVLNADTYELNYLVNKIDYYTVRSDLTNKVKIITANPFTMPFADDSFDCTLLLDFTRQLKKSDLHIALKEIYRITKVDGFCFSNEIQPILFDKTPFIADENFNFNYYIKKKRPSALPYESTYSLSDGINFFKNKKYQEASMIIHSLINQREDIDLELYKVLLLIYIRQGDAFKIEYLERMLKMHGIVNADFDFIIGSYYFNKNDYSASEGFFARAVQNSPDFVYAEYYLALIEKMCGKLESSRERFKNILNKINTGSVYSPELYSDIMSIEMIEYIAENEIEGVKS